MDTNDPRHGTYAGAVAHWFDKDRPCDACATAETRYRKLRKLDLIHGKPRRVPAVGIVRRFHALLALGYTGPRVAQEAGVPLNTLRALHYHGSETVGAETAQKVIDAYDRLCMVRPEGRYAVRARGMAARRGWAPPLAWDDIDDPDEQPHLDDSDNEPDPVVIDRLLAGDFTLARSANRAERVEIVRRWRANGQALNELARATGWEPRRYLTTNEEAA